MYAASLKRKSSSDGAGSVPAMKRRRAEVDGTRGDASGNNGVRPGSSKTKGSREADSLYDDRFQVPQGTRRRGRNK